MEAPHIRPSLPTEQNTLFSTIPNGILFNKYDILPLEVSIVTSDDPWEEEDSSSGWKVEPSSSFVGKDEEACSSGVPRDVVSVAKKGIGAAPAPHLDAGGRRRGDCSKHESYRPHCRFKCQQKGHTVNAARTRLCLAWAPPHQSNGGTPYSAISSYGSDTLFSTISNGSNFVKYDVIPVEVRMVASDDPWEEENSSSGWKVEPSSSFVGKDEESMTGSGKMVAFVLLMLHTLVRDTSLENPSYQPLQILMVVVLSPTHE
ncbi:hypothetical protein MRX96_056012 [Rhipicephalus microplus]